MIRVTCPAQAEQCPECQACYVRSCASFECIPAVEVSLEDGITDKEVNTRDRCHMTAGGGEASADCMRRTARLSSSQVHRVEPNE